ncbi:MAG TPA: hypothetical protein P5522_05865 [Spirochaetia bacterium]|nr:hypothetical protein [Spirochaetia bacterium]
MGSIVDPASYAVLDRDMLAEVTLNLMKIKGVHIMFGEKPEYPTAQLVGYLGEIKKNDGSIHYIVYNSEKNLLYDYHRPKLTQKARNYISVWLYTD